MNIFWSSVLVAAVQVNGFFFMVAPFALLLAHVDVYNFLFASLLSSCLIRRIRILVVLDALLATVH